MCRQFSFKYLGLQYLSNKTGRSEFLLFILLQYKGTWVKGKSLCSGKDMFCGFFYTLSMEKIAQGCIFFNFFFKKKNFS